MEKILGHRKSETRKCELSDDTNHRPRHFFCRLSRFLSTVSRFDRSFFVFPKCLYIPRKVAWIRHKDLAILSVGQLKYSSDNRYDLVHRKITNEYQLHINYLQPKDAGVYECQVSTKPVSAFYISLKVAPGGKDNKQFTVETSITKLTFYHIRCFLLSKDAFTPNLTEFGPVTRARAPNLALNQSRIERRKKVSDSDDQVGVLRRQKEIS